MLEHVHHIAVIGSDRERSLEFYVNKLGFEITRDVHREAQQDDLIMLRSGSVMLELFIKSNAPARPSGPEAQGLRHLAFHVESVEDTVRWLNSRGIETEPIRLDPIFGGHFTFFKDPDGLPLEIHE